MKPRVLQILLGLAMSTLVLLIAYVDLRQNSPGPLSRVHAEIADLEGRSGCADCHGGWGQDMASACLDCHQPVQDHLESRAGLHGNLDPIQAQACSLCHSEHHGPEFALTNFKSFALASASAPEDFDHSFIGFSLDGAHEEMGCVECHKLADAPLLQAGQQRYMGLSRGCNSCHEDPHEDRMQRDCTECHDQLSFAEISFVKHAEQLQLVGAHGGRDCRACHAQQDAHALEKLASGVEPRSCASCHATPHSPQFERGNARLAGLEWERNCVSCHVAEHLVFSSAAELLSAEQHAPSGFALTMPHAEQACAACHGEHELGFETRYPGRAAQACAACHADPHAGQFEALQAAEGRSFAASSCVDCHARTEFLPHTFDQDKHAQTGLALLASHASTECNACHLQPSEQEARRFRATSLECSSCHQDAHAGAFEGRIQSAELGQHGECAVCHEPTSFDQVADFDHGRRTRFEVRGAHAAGACTLCHAPLDERDAQGRHFAPAPAGVEERGCSLCHADPHLGAFDAESLPQRVEQRAGCARCHVEHSFRELVQPFEHRLWTGFDLEPAHGELGCAACHKPLRGSQGGGLTWQHALGVSCADCHASPHGGQFQRDGKQECASCHANASSFVDLSFDHDQKTAFALGEEHVGVACGACHETWIQGDQRVVRYRGVASACSACHGLQKDRLRGGK